MSPVLSRRLTLEAPTRLPDGAGGFTTAWTPLGFLWAEVAAGLPREGGAPAGTRVGARVRITVRGAAPGAPSRPLAGQRLREGARTFRILSVAEADPHGRHLTCQAEEETAL